MTDLSSTLYSSPHGHSKNESAERKQRNCGSRLSLILKMFCSLIKFCTSNDTQKKICWVDFQGWCIEYALILKTDMHEIRRNIQTQ